MARGSSNLRRLPLKSEGQTSNPNSHESQRSDPIHEGSHLNCRKQHRRQSRQNSQASQKTTLARHPENLNSWKPGKLRLMLLTNIWLTPVSQIRSSKVLGVKECSLLIADIFEHVSNKVNPNLFYFRIVPEKCHILHPETIGKYNQNFGWIAILDFVQYINRPYSILVRYTLESTELSW